MRVHTLFFAAYKDLLGLSKLELDVPEGCTISELVATLRARGGGFLSLPNSPAVAVNRTYSFADAVLAPGDEIAFIPPVAGG